MFPEPSEFTPGRRVNLRDLIGAGLLEPGAKLRWVRPNVGQDHLATLDEAGRISLADGRAFSAPSRAANEVVGSGSFDGWLAWRVVDTNELLDSVRQRYLRDVVPSFAPSEPKESVDEQVFLSHARARADAGDPVKVSVRDLLSHWGLASRDLAAADRVSADLANHGLTSAPNFLKVSLDAPVTLNSEQLVSGDATTAENSAPASQEDALEVGVTLGNLLDPDSPLVSVTRESSLNEAITLMLLNDYSQLPVLANERSLRGAITWQSIAKASHAGRPETVGAAMVRCSLKSYEDELIDVLGILEEEDFVLVHDATTRIVGIITAADVVRKYGEVATPFFLVGELDQYLRRIISDRFPLQTVRRICQQAGHELDDFNQMTMGDYQAVLEDRDCWAQMEWSLDRRSFIKRFNEMRILRNDLMHFNRDQVLPADIEKLRRLIQVLRTYALE